MDYGPTKTNEMNGNEQRENQLLARLKNEHIRPLPRAYFIWNEFGRWVMLLGSLIIGAIAVSVLIYANQQAGVEILEHATHSRVEMFLALTPVLWLISMLGFISFSVWLTRQTRRGYRHSWLKIMSISIASSMVLGYACYQGGGAEWIDNQLFFSNLNLPSIENQKRKLWSDATEGRLAGVIVSISDSLLLIKDLRDKTWTVDVRQAFIKPSVDYHPGTLIKCLGHLAPDGRYVVTEIRPWVGRGRRGVVN